MKLNFERTAEYNGIFKPSTIIYDVSDEQGRNQLRLTIAGRSALVETSYERIELLKNIWGRTWNLAGDMKQMFVRFSMGWTSRIELPDGTDYSLKVARSWSLFKTGNIPGALQAVVTYNGEPIFTLDDYAKRNWFSAEITRPMKGEIATSLTDLRKIAAFLLAIQNRVTMQNQAHA